MLVVDCFLFYNEMDLLFYRLSLLYDIVDYFVIVESTKTHAGNKKPLYYLENKDRYKNFEDKIIHIVEDDLMSDPTHDLSKGFHDEVWSNEHLHRNAIHKGIEQISLSDNDILIISDLDEIPDPLTIQYLKTNLSITDNIGIVSLLQDFYYYCLTCKNKEKWTRSKLVSYQTYVSQFHRKPQDCRMYECDRFIEKGGWHLSYFGSPEFIQNKLEQFAHQEYNKKEYTNMDTIQRQMKTKQDLFSRTNEVMQNIDLLNNNYLPPDYDLYLKPFLW